MRKLEVNAYEPVAEWKVRRIPEPSKEPSENYSQRLKHWALSSIGIEGTAKEVFLYIENSKMATEDDLQKRLQKSPEEMRECLDLLYSTGLLEHIGRAYYVRGSLSSLIVTRLIPKITESLRSIASIESKARTNIDYCHRMTGRSFSDVDGAIVACKEISRVGATPIARVAGVRSYNGEAVEVEGVVIDYGHDPPHLVMVGESGEKVIVGRKDDKGSDVKAHSLLVRGEKK